MRAHLLDAESYKWILDVCYRNGTIFAEYEMPYIESKCILLDTL